MARHEMPWANLVIRFIDEQTIWAYGLITMVFENRQLFEHLRQR
jgi:hypothetical protein